MPGLHEAVDQIGPQPGGCVGRVGRDGVRVVDAEGGVRRDVEVRLDAF